MRRVVFLDIDGVVNPDEWCEKQGTGHGYKFDPATVAVINEITERSGAEIVVSSMWRYYFTLGRLREILRSNGIQAPVRDVTPSVGEGRYEDRGQEIAAWLEAHPEVGACVILDDVNAMGNLADLLVQTDPRVGLQLRHVKPALELLGVA